MYVPEKIMSSKDVFLLFTWRKKCERKPEVPLSFIPCSKNQFILIWIFASCFWFTEESKQLTHKIQKTATICLSLCGFKRTTENGRGKITTLEFYHFYCDKKYCSIVSFVFCWTKLQSKALRSLFFYFEHTDVDFDAIWSFPLLLY